MGGERVSIAGRFRDVSSLTRAEALVVLEREMVTTSVLHRALGHLMNDPLSHKVILRRMRVQVVTALLGAMFLGVAIGALAAQAVRWWSFT